MAKPLFLSIRPILLLDCLCRSHGLRFVYMYQQYMRRRHRKRHHCGFFGGIQALRAHVAELLILPKWNGRISKDLNKVVDEVYITQFFHHFLCMRIMHYFFYNFSFSFFPFFFFHISDFLMLKNINLHSIIIDWKSIVHIWRCSPWFFIFYYFQKKKKK